MAPAIQEPRAACRQVQQSSVVDGIGNAVDSVFGLDLAIAGEPQRKMERILCTVPGFQVQHKECVTLDRAFVVVNIVMTSDHMRA